MVKKNRTKDMNWDLDSFFPTFNGSEMRAFKKKLGKDITAVRKQAAALASLNKNSAANWEKIFLKAEHIIQRLSHLGSYIGCLCAGDARNETYKKEEAELVVMEAEFAKVEIEMLRAIKESSTKIFDSFKNKPSLKDARYYLERMRTIAHLQMDREREILATDLNVDGFNAWGRLYDTIAGKMDFEMEFPDGHREKLPMSQRRSLMEHSDREVRRAAFNGGNAAWAVYADVAAAALNAISGTRLTLYCYRGVKHFLDMALFQSAITRKTLDAMFEAIYANLDVPQRILKLKAKTMGRRAIAWYDLGAPLNIGNTQELSWDKAKNMVVDAFNTAYPALGGFIQSMFRKQWIESEPRPGKLPGAFCTGSLLTKESRVFMTFNKTLGDALTLAHEVGHAFHSYVLRDVRPYAHLYPMTLAETASTFGEKILSDGILSNPAISQRQKALILDMEINHGAIYLMDIPVRFEFEKKMYEERAKGELGVSRLKELMVETQQKIFGNLLEKDGEDPMFWASKLHFYITGTTFYNFPYTFGYLLSRGLYAMFKQEGKSFLPRYEEFLRLTGSDTAVNVARRSIGRNLERSEFWTEAIRSLEEPLKIMERLAPKLKRISSVADEKR